MVPVLRTLQTYKQVKMRVHSENFDYQVVTMFIYREAV